MLLACLPSLAGCFRTARRGAARCSSAAVGLELIFAAAAVFRNGQVRRPSGRGHQWSGLRYDREVGGFAAGNIPSVPRRHPRWDKGPSGLCGATPRRVTAPPALPSRGEYVVPMYTGQFNGEGPQQEEGTPVPVRFPGEDWDPLAWSKAWVRPYMAALSPGPCRCAV
eukprot:scaffold2391_cov381-Prasinococcus_capsulatus_cf.AAC.7